MLLDERPHLKLLSRSGGAYLLPPSMLEDAKDFIESRDPLALLQGRDVYGAVVYIERSDVVALIVFDAPALVALREDHEERTRRSLFTGGDR